MTVDAWAEATLDLLTDRAGVRRAGLALAEGGGRRLRFTASDRDSGGGPEWCFVDAYDDVPLNTAVRTGNPVVGVLEDLEGRYPAFVERQRGTTTVALAAVPLAGAGQTLGGFVLFYELPQTFDPRQRQDLQALGEELGTSLRRAQRAQGRPDIDLADAPVVPGALVAIHEIPADPASVADARRFLRRVLEGWDIDEVTTDIAALCLSELATNAVIHARSGCVVRVLLEDGVLTTTVRDAGTRDAPPAAPVDDPLQVHGRGLQVVDALAARWGSEVDAVGTTVWFVLHV